MNLFATIVDREADWADLFFLVAVILFAVLTVWDLTDKAVKSALLAAGLGFGFLGLLVL